MTQDAQLKIVPKTGSSTNKKQHADGCEYIHTVVNGRQLIIYHIADVRQELRDQLIAARNEIPPWSTKAFARTVRGIEYHDGISPGIVADEFYDKRPREWAKQALITLQEAMKAYIIEVIAASHCLKQQLISCRYSSCLLQWQRKEVVYSWNSSICTWP